MIQLVQPNLGVVGRPDYCLLYVQTAFGAPAASPTAWKAWEACAFKHTDAIPTDVSVPVWFSWSGSVEGVWDNYGHVAISTPQGVYTNPLSGSGHKVFASVAALESAYGVKYVGWSEDIETLRVVEEDIVKPTYQQVLDNFRAYLGRDCTEAEQNEFVAQDIRVMYAFILMNQNPNWPALRDKENADAGLQTKIDQLTAANLKLTDQITALKATPVAAPTSDPQVTVTRSGLWAALLKFLGKG